MNFKIMFIKNKTHLYYNNGLFALAAKKLD